MHFCLFSLCLPQPWTRHSLLSGINRWFGDVALPKDVLLSGFAFQNTFWDGLPQILRIDTGSAIWPQNGHQMTYGLGRNLWIDSLSGKMTKNKHSMSPNCGVTFDPTLWCHGADLCWLLHLSSQLQGLTPRALSDYVFGWWWLPAATKTSRTNWITCWRIFCKLHVFVLL